MKKHFNMGKYVLALLVTALGYTFSYGQARNVGIGEVMVIELGAHDTILLGTMSNGLSIYNSTTQIATTFDNTNSPLTDDTILAVLFRSVANVEHIFVGSQNGLLRFRNNTWDTLSHIGHQKVNGLLMTAGDTLWVLTANNGAIIFDSTGDNYLGTFTTGNSSIPTNLISAAQRGNAGCGDYAMGTSNKGCFYTSDGVTYSVLDTSAAGKRLVNNNVTAVYMKNDCSARLVGTVAGYSSCPPGLNCTNFTVNNGLPQNHITAIGEDCNGKIWLGTHDSGIIIYNPRINATDKFIDVFDALHRTSLGLINGPKGYVFGNNFDDGTRKNGFLFWFDPNDPFATSGSVAYDSTHIPSAWRPIGNPAYTDSFLWVVTRKVSVPQKLGSIIRFNPRDTTSILAGLFDTITGGPPTGLISATNHTLYGTTGKCSTHPYGTLFKFDIAKSVLSMLVDFDSVGNGAFPDLNLTVGDDGFIYGSTPVGGAHNKGTLFKVDTATGVCTKLHDFNGPDGANPSGPVILSGDGNLYGTTQKGGSIDSGTLFTFDKVAGITIIKNFVSPLTTPMFLYQAKNGIFYGLTKDNSGSLFQYNRYNGVFNTLHQFNTGDGIGTNPYPLMSETSLGTVFGRTTAGGLINLGTVYQFDPQYAEFKKYNTSNGLASNQVTAIMFDPNKCATDGGAGYIGTQDGSLVSIDQSGDLTPVDIKIGVPSIKMNLLGVYVYPQPAVSDIKFVFSRAVPGSTLRICDLYGRQLQEFRCGSEAIMQADVSGFSSGLYFYTISSGANLLTSGRLAVVK